MSPPLDFIDKSFRILQMGWYQKYLIVIFKLKLLSRFEAKRFMPLDRAHLRGHSAPVKRRGDALFVIWTVVENDPHQKGVFSAALITMNVNFVGWHGGFPSPLIFNAQKFETFARAKLSVVAQ